MHLPILTDPSEHPLPATYSHGWEGNSTLFALDPQGRVKLVESLQTTSLVSLLAPLAHFLGADSPTVPPSQKWGSSAHLP